nr:hypothetical protein [uncultured Brevundimonas sp.]
MTRPAPTVTDRPSVLVSVPVEPIQRLILAADSYGVRYLDSDDMTAEAQELQDATEAMKDLIAAPAAPQATGVGEREAIARIVDPQVFDLIASYVGIDRGDGLTPDQREPSVFKAYPTLKEDRERALAKADAILALRAPSREPEGGPVDGWRTIDSAPIGELVQVYWPCMALDDDGEPTGETLDREGHVSLSVRHSEQHGWEPDNVVEANGDWFGDDFEFGQPTHWRPRPSRPAAAIATREEAPAEAGDARPLCVIAFREGKREPELISWDRMPVGEYKLYGDAQNLGFLIDTDDGTEWAEEDPRMSGIPEYFENVRPLTLETAKEEMLSAWEIRSELEAALRAPSREPEGGAVDDGAFKIATDLHKAYEQLIYGLPKYLDAENLTDEENMIREAWVTLDVTAHRLAALATREEAPASHVSDRYKFDDEIAWLREAARYFSARDTKGEDRAHWANVYNAENARKLADRLAELSSNPCQLEAPAEAGEAARIIARHLPLADAPDTVCLPITMTAGDLRTVYAALRAQPQAREDAQPVGWLRAADEEMVCAHLGVADAEDSYETAKQKLASLIQWNIAVATDPRVEGRPAPDALRVAVEALEPFAYFAKHGTSREYINSDAPDDGLCAAASFPAGAYRGAVQALAALQAEQKGGA